MSSSEKIEIKKILTEHNEDIKRHMGALSEDFQDKVSAIAEQYFDIKKTLDLHTQILDSHGETLKSHTEMIGIIMEDMTEVKSTLRQKVDRDDFELLEKRVTTLEK